MSKKDNAEPINNLMLRSIDAIYKYGGFEIDGGENTLELFVDNGILTIQVYESKTSQCKRSTTLINNLLATLCYCTFFNNQNKIINILPKAVRCSEKARLKCANEMYDVYEHILLHDPKKIREVISENNVSVFLKLAANLEANSIAFDDIEILKRELVHITSDYSEDLMYGLELYSLMKEASPSKLCDLEKEWNMFEFHLKNNNKTSKTEEKKEAQEELETPHEIINDRYFPVNPAVGRESEIRALGAALLSYSVNPILLGEPGVGKTSIIEGLAYNINEGTVSEKLLNKKIMKISPTAIVSGCIYRGSFEERILKLIDYLIKHQEYILYIDEIHTAYGTGASMSSDNDILNILKPYIENGTIKVIGATTTKEYEEFILKDKAFARRLRPITVSEPKAEVLKQIIKNNIQKYEQASGILFANSDSEKELLIDILIDVTEEKNRSYKEKRYNPSLVLSIIEQAFGYASYDKKEYVGRDYIIESLSLCESIYESSRQKAINELKTDLPKDPQKPKILYLYPTKESDN